MANPSDGLRIPIIVTKQGQGDVEAARGLDALKGKIGEVLSAGSTLAGTLGFAELDDAAIGAGVLAFLKDSIAEANQSAAAQVRLQAALRNTGQAGEEEIGALSAKYQALTNVSDETWSDAAAKLIQFGAQVNEIPQLFPVIEGLAGRMGGDVPAAAELLARALGGNTRGLAQFGIKLEEGSSRAQILAAVTQAAAAGAGVLAAQAQTAAGRMEALSNAVGDLKETVGGAITGSKELGSTLDLVTKGVQFTTQNFDKLLIVINSLTGASAVLKTISQAMGLFAESAEKAAGDAGLVGGAVGALAKPTTDAAGAAGNLAKELATARKEADGLRAALDGVSDAMSDQEAAKVDRDLAEGKISEADAASAKAKIKAESELTKLNREKEAQAEKQKKLTDDLATAQKAKDEAFNKGDQKTYGAEQEKIAKLEAEKAALQAKLAEIEIRKGTVGINKDTEESKADKMRREEQKRRDDTNADLNKTGAEGRDRAKEMADEADQREMDRNRSPISARPEPRKRGDRTNPGAPRSERDTMAPGANNLDDLKGPGSPELEALKQKAAANKAAAEKAAQEAGSAVTDSTGKVAEIGTSLQGFASAVTSAMDGAVSALEDQKAQITALESRISATTSYTA